MRIGLLFLLASSTLLAATAARPATLLIPRGTVVYGHLDERITTNTRKFRVGFPLYASVWKDVQVNGITVIKAGTPIAAEISQLAPRGIGGRGAEIQIRAFTVPTITDVEVDLDGGYGQETRDRQGLNRAVSALFWPASFIPGKRAVLEEGMVFDTEIKNDVRIEVPDDVVPTLNLAPPSGLNVSIVFGEFTSRSTTVPLEIRLCEHDWTNDIAIDSVNNQPVHPIPISVRSRLYVDNCDIAQTEVDLDALNKHFTRGINRFTVRLGELSEEVVLNIEM